MPVRRSRRRRAARAAALGAAGLHTRRRRRRTRHSLVLALAPRLALRPSSSPRLGPRGLVVDRHNYYIVSRLLREISSWLQSPVQTGDVSSVAHSEHRHEQPRHRDSCER